MGNNFVYLVLAMIIFFIIMIIYSYNKRLKLVKIIKTEIEKINE